MSKKARSYARALVSVLLLSIVVIIAVSSAVGGVKTFFSPAHKGNVVNVVPTIGFERYSYEIADQNGVRTYKIDDEIWYSQRYKLGDEVTFYVAGDSGNAQFHRGLNFIGFVGALLLAIIIMPGVIWLVRRVKAKNKPTRPDRVAHRR